MVSLEFHLGSVLKNIALSSLEDMGNVALQPLMVPSYSIARKRSSEVRYENKGPSMKAFGFVSISWYVLILFGKF